LKLRTGWAALCHASHENRKRAKHVESILVPYSDAGSNPASSTFALRSFSEEELR